MGECDLDLVVEFDNFEVREVGCLLIIEGFVGTTPGSAKVGGSPIVLPRYLEGFFQHSASDTEWRKSSVPVPQRLVKALL